MARILFLFGAARSGTSALVQVLNVSPEIAMGMERYFYLFAKRSLVPSHFSRERFFSIMEGDTHSRGSFPLMKKDRDLTFIGDKFPELFKHYEWITNCFPDANYLYIIRNPFSVVESSEVRYHNKDDTYSRDYKTMLTDWNNSLQLICSLTPKQLSKIKVLIYEELFDSVKSLDNLIVSLTGSSVDQEQLANFVKHYHALKGKLIPRQEDLRYYICKNADWDAYKKTCVLAHNNDVFWR